MKNLVFYYPTIYDDGLKKTFQLYTNYLKEKFKIILVTNTCNKKNLKFVNKKIKIINLQNNFISKFKFINEILCLIRILGFINKNSIIFSADKHFYLLILKFIGLKFKLILRIPNPIFNPNSKGESKFLNKKFFSNNPGSELGVLDLKFLKYANIVIVYSKNHYKFLKKKYKLSNLKLIRNYFPKNYVRRNSKKIKNIFFIGRLVNSKDPIFFLRNTLNILKSLDIKIHIVGNGPLLKSMIEIAKKHKKFVKFYGFVKDPFKKYNKKIDLFCLTSKFDGTPNVLGEAISYKIPCLAPRGVGCVNEILNNGKFGSVYSPGNNLDFKKKINISIKNRNKTVKKSKMAFDNLENYSESNTLKKLKFVLENL
tara:strand:- start:406 stop:1509 length:1104 start_codon:yes stop_codon:yes gene_type:complete